jgi:2-dehydropantoate 2-reductase
MRILIIGAGATGGFFGSRLAQAGRDVTFLVRPGRAAQLAKHGLQVLSPSGDSRITPQLLTADQLDRPFDVIILAVKAYALDSALADMAPAVGPQTLVVPLLNGMRHIDAITERFGAGVLIGGVCKVNAEVDGEGRIIQHGAINHLAYGELDGQSCERTARLHELLSGAGFETALSTTIKQALWDKWVLLASLGSINSLTRGNVGEVAAVEGGQAFASRMIDEVVAIVSAVGVAPDAEGLAQIRQVLTQKGSKQTSSMYRDLSAGAPIEAQQIVGDLLRRAQGAGIDTPLLSAAHVNLQVYQQRLQN